ncbi:MULTISPECIES: maleylpyruvate isomerase family mycothiol-dependent enzyme [unclassified Amycolatopsis]|uniref:maleylpyruvate isomerase family mycothiol-dependent enzyme n=1 Tax=unclassified Amycolatopsis TaxID=2618356 RepID=UPI001C6A58A5|nr:maleylpyruvate isomerase family mycothiol-dependent enzyme [Amycolatopsis sp. DSM 110486]QYN23500.1 maleylpyruvate isomerase family mycothiol-dependent enzyme [Amycolatopsis sp. DSM 110486]
MDFERRAAEIVAQTELLQATAKGADLATRIAACPDWSLGQLLNHVGAGHRYAEGIVRTRASEAPADDYLRNPGHEVRPGSWLTDGARALATTLREAGPDAEVWTPVPAGAPRAAFYARRFLHETAMHRADVTLALGRSFTLDGDVAHDILDEWLELGSLPVMFDYFPERRALQGPGHTIHLAPTDHAASWTVDLTGDLPAWHPGTVGNPAVTVEAPLTDLLLIIYARVPATTAKLTGDTEFLGTWLSLVSFG